MQCPWHWRFTLIFLYMHEALKIDLQMTSHIYKSNDSLQLSADRNVHTACHNTTHVIYLKTSYMAFTNILVHLLHDCMNWDVPVLQDFLLLLFTFGLCAFFVYLCFLHLFACVLFSGLRCCRYRSQAAENPSISCCVSPCLLLLLGSCVICVSDF